MKTIKNDYCIRLFTGYDELRPHFIYVHLKDGHLYATNAHMIAKVSADNCVKSYAAVEHFPNAEKIIADHVSAETRKVKVDQLFRELMEIEVCFKPKMLECGNCKGTGVETCSYCDSEHDCKTCNGIGEVKSTELVMSGEYNCKIFNRKYKLHYIDLIIRTAIYTGVKEIEISNGEGHEAVFSVGDFTILLMRVFE